MKIFYFPSTVGTPAPLTINMSSRQETPADLTDDTFDTVSDAPSGPSIPSAFGRMMSSTSTPAPPEPSKQRDRCQRPVPSYNAKYDPYKIPPEDLLKSYSPYVKGEPLFDDRPVVISQLPSNHVIAGASARPRTQWVWNLGYALNDSTKRANNLVWTCKLCTYSSGFLTSY